MLNERTNFKLYKGEIRSMYVDLHMHSTYSDGTDDIVELYEKAKSLKLEKMALTDHNVIEGSVKLHKLDPDFCVKGVEIDCYYNEHNLHILVYDYDEKNIEFLELVKKTNYELLHHDDMIIYELVKENLFELSEYEKFNKNVKLGGWKSLQFLIHKGIVNDINEFFVLQNKYLSENNKPKYYSLETVIDIAHKANGKVVFAHPFKSVKTNQYKTIEEIVKMNIDGIEVYYPSHSKEDTFYLENLALKHKLFKTCGCDYHGPFQSTSIGQLKVNI